MFCHEMGGEFGSVMWHSYRDEPVDECLALYPYKIEVYPGWVHVTKALGCKSVMTLPMTFKQARTRLTALRRLHATIQGRLATDPDIAMHCSMIRAEVSLKVGDIVFDYLDIMRVAREMCYDLCELLEFRSLRIGTALEQANQWLHMAQTGRLVQGPNEGRIPVLKVGSYRGIKLVEHAMKVLERVIERRVRNIVKNDSMQFGLWLGKAQQMQFSLFASYRRSIWQGIRSFGWLLWIWRRLLTGFPGRWFGGL